MTHPSDPVTGGGGVERVARAICLYEHGDMDAAWQEIAWPDFEGVARAAIAAFVDAPVGIAASIVVARASACLHQHQGNSATMICVAAGDHDGRHVYHRIETVSILEPEREDHGPRS